MSSRYNNTCLTGLQKKFLPHREGTSGFDYSSNRHKKRTGARGRPSHLQSDQSEAEEKCLSGRHHLSWYSPHTHATCCSSSGQLPCWRATLDNESPL